MATAVIGEIYTFHVKFLDGTNIPFVPIDPQIEVFYFDDAGTKSTLVAAGTPMTPVPSDSGRFSFIYMIPTSMTPGTTIYGLMSGTDPTTNLRAIYEDDVELVTEAAATPAVTGGLTARFFKC